MPSSLEWRSALDASKLCPAVHLRRPEGGGRELRGLPNTDKEFSLVEKERRGLCVESRVPLLVVVRI